MVERSEELKNAILRHREEFRRAFIVVVGEKGMTYTELSCRLGTKKEESVAHWVSGRRVPNVENFGKLLEVLQPAGVSADALVGSWAECFNDRLEPGYYGPPAGIQQNREKFASLRDVKEKLMRKRYHFEGGFSQAFAAEVLQVTRQRVNQIVREKKLVTPLSPRDFCEVALSIRNIKIVE